MSMTPIENFAARIALSLVAFLGLASLALPATAASVAIRDTRVFDGEKVIERATVLVEDGKIAAVGADLQIPTGVEVVEGRGKTLLPGLIDSHTHAFGPALVRALVFGVTTELDMFSSHVMTADLRRQQKAGEAQGRADIVSASTLVTAPGGHGTQFGMDIPTLTKPEDADAFVADRLAEGSDFIKIVLEDGSAHGFSIPTLSHETVAATIRAAHRRETMAVVHVSTLETARFAVDSGADGLVHIFRDEATDEAFVRLAREKGAFVIPTLSVLVNPEEVWAGGLGEDPELEPWVTTAETQSLDRRFPSNKGRDMRVPLKTVKRLFDAGVPILAGTDAPNPGTAHGISMHREMSLLVEAGLTPTQALAAATSVPAKAFGLDDRGRIRPGLRADLLLVEGDPTQSILATRKIAGVWKEGHRLDRPRNDAPAAKSDVPAPGPISNFDDGEMSAAVGFGWQPSTDQMMGGKSVVEIDVVEGGADGTAKALSVRGEIRPGFAFPWAGAMYFPGAQPMQPLNASGAEVVRFWAQGDGGTYSVMLFSSASGQMPVMRTFVASEEWKLYELPFKDFAGIDPSELLGITFSAGQGQTEFAFRIDQLELR